MPGESRFNRKLGDIAVSRAGNGGPTPADILEALRALNDDALERDETRDVQLARIVSHLESEQGHISTSVGEALRRHCDAVDSPMMLRISALEAEHSEMKAVVDDRGARIEQAKKEVIDEIFARQRPRREGDPGDTDHTNDRAIIVAEKKFTREQVVVAIIIFASMAVGSNLVGALLDRALK